MFYDFPSTNYQRPHKKFNFSEEKITPLPPPEKTSTSTSISPSPHLHCPISIMPTQMLLNSFTSINNRKNVNISFLFLPFPFFLPLFIKKYFLRVGEWVLNPFPHSHYIICHAILSAADLLSQ